MKGQVMTESQALAKCARAFIRLQDNEDFKAAVDCLVNLRVVYGMVTDSIRRQIAASEDPPAELADYVAQFVSWQAQAPRRADATLISVANYIASILESLDLEEPGEPSGQLNPTKQQFDIGITLEDDSAIVHRGTSLTFIGPAAAVQWVLASVAKTLVSSNVASVVQFTTGEVRPEDQSFNNILFPSEAWATITNSHGTFQKFLAEHFYPVVSAVDVIIVSNLSHANNDGFVGRSRYAQAGDAHHKFSKLAEACGKAALISGIFTPDELPDTQEADFWQLRAHSYIVPVTVENHSANNTTISVGKTKFIVANEVLQSLPTEGRRIVTE
jgi:hypothetical protein